MVLFGKIVIVFVFSFNFGLILGKEHKCISMYSAIIAKLERTEIAATFYSVR